jgi:hypothetical protein
MMGSVMRSRFLVLGLFFVAMVVIPLALGTRSVGLAVLALVAMVLGSALGCWQLSEEEESTGRDT